MSVPVNPYSVNNNVSQEHDAISERLVAARASAEALPSFPGELPDSLHDAYAIQTASIARWPDEIGGWKVGGVPDSFREKLGAKKVAGPIFRSSIFSIESGATIAMPIFDGGFAAVEAEFVLRLGQSIEPVEKDYTDEELIELIAAVHIGAEIASSPMSLVNKLGPCCVASDFGNNAGLLVGPSVLNGSDLPVDSLTVTVTVDNVVVGSEKASLKKSELLESLRFLVALCAKRGITLAAGSFVSSGAITGIHDVTVESSSTVDFGSGGSFSVAFEPMTPRQ